MVERISATGWDIIEKDYDPEPIVKKMKDWRVITTVADITGLEHVLEDVEEAIETRLKNEFGNDVSENSRISAEYRHKCRGCPSEVASL